MELIKLEHPSIEDQKEFKGLIEKHYLYTQSKLAKNILDNWKENSGKFIKVMPIEYKKALQKLKEEKMKQDKSELKTA
jgi:glutamate synthase (ferredoxin)